MFKGGGNADDTQLGIRDAFVKAKVAKEPDDEVYAEMAAENLIPFDTLGKCLSG